MAGIYSERLSFIVPVLNDLEALRHAIHHLKGLSEYHQVILVDGGSDDGSFECAMASSLQCIRSPAGRALQMNAGAAIATGDVLIFLHCDSRLTTDAPERVLRSLRQSSWGHFNVRFSPNSPLLAIIAWSMNQRARFTGVATGDQTLFFRHDFFYKLRGFATIPLMEDIDICRRARLLAHSGVITQPAITSSRRWRKNGTLRTVLHMWSLRFRYWLGERPEVLHKSYYPARKP